MTETKRDRLARIVARAYGGSQHPELGMLGDHPAGAQDYIAADAILADDRREYPALLRLGAYAFFAWLTFWSSIPVAILCRWIGAPDFVRQTAGSVVIFVTFMTLRDMTKRERRP